MVFGDTKSKNVNTGCTDCHASPAETRVKSVPVWHVQTQTKTKSKHRYGKHKVERFNDEENAQVASFFVRQD